MDEPLTARDEIHAIRDALSDAGFDVHAVHGQQLTYYSPTGDRFTVLVTKNRNR
ncbi:hypothetical protein [Nocardia puris]|uniref:HicA-like toxin of HicAB toxin-antitoxin system n=1 Tax=Nocardia puris TaxID=208602 RepID=A0A366CSG7_9NOCA|nr:hypothetical protein [Nocardia puris]RBO78310.1 hypothetical protein DFR74_1524 [Nocardia puris]